MTGEHFTSLMQRRVLSLLSHCTLREYHNFKSNNALCFYANDANLKITSRHRKEYNHKIYTGSP